PWRRGRHRNWGTCRRAWRDLWWQGGESARGNGSKSRRRDKDNRKAVLVASADPLPHLPLRRPPHLFAHIGPDGADDARLLLGGEVGEHRQRQHAAARLLAGGEVPLAVAQPRQALLQMQRDRVIDLAADPLIIQ